MSSVSFELSLWDPNSVTNSADVPNLITWKTISTFADSTAAGLSRGQADPPRTATKTTAPRPTG